MPFLIGIIKTQQDSKPIFFNSTFCHRSNSNFFLFKPGYNLNVDDMSTKKIQKSSIKVNLLTNIEQNTLCDCRGNKLENNCSKYTSASMQSS